MKMYSKSKGKGGKYLKWKLVSETLEPNALFGFPFEGGLFLICLFADAQHSRRIHGVATVQQQVAVRNNPASTKNDLLWPLLTS